MKPKKEKGESAVPDPSGEEGLLKPGSRDDFLNQLNSLNPGDDIGKTTTLDLMGILEARLSAQVQTVAHILVLLLGRWTPIYWGSSRPSALGSPPRISKTKCETAYCY